MLMVFLVILLSVRNNNIKEENEMEENERVKQMWKELWDEFDELTGWRDIDFEANIIKEESK